MDTDSDDDCYGAIGSMWGMKPHVAQSTHTHTQLDFENTSSSSQYSSLETGLETLHLNSMSSEDESSSSEDRHRSRRRSRKDRFYKKVMRKLERIEQHQQVMAKFLNKVNDALEKMAVPVGGGGYPYQRRLKLDIRLIKFLQTLGQGSVTQEERNQIDQLTTDIKAEVSQVIRDLHQELDEAETELGVGSAKERANGTETETGVGSAKRGENGTEEKGERSKESVREESEPALEIRVRKQDIIHNVSSDEKSCHDVSSGGDNSDDDMNDVDRADDGNGGDTRRANGDEGHSQGMDGRKGVSNRERDRKERDEKAIKSLDLVYHQILTEAAQQGTRYTCQLCSVSMYEKGMVLYHVRSALHKQKLPDLVEQLERNKIARAEINGPDVERQEGRPSPHHRPKRNRTPTGDDSRSVKCFRLGCEKPREQQFLDFCSRECYTIAVKTSETKLLKQ